MTPNQIWGIMGALERAPMIPSAEAAHEALYLAREVTLDAWASKVATPGDARKMFDTASSRLERIEQLTALSGEQLPLVLVARILATNAQEDIRRNCC